MEQIAIPAVPLGSVLDIWCGGYWHKAISGPLAIDGKPRLISATSRTGTVIEEPWDDVVQGRPVRLISSPGSWVVGAKIVEKARSLIGIWKYNVFTRNCEHFVSMVLEGRPSSPQLVKVGLITLSAVGAGVVISRIR